MIKKIFLVLSISFSGFLLNAQDFNTKVAIEICNCIDTIENMDSLNAKAVRCAYAALEIVLETASEEVQDIFSNDNAVEESLTSAMKMLFSECPKIREFILDDRASRFYRMSDSEEANKNYEDGNRLFKAGSLKEALKPYKDAVRTDPQFVYALDNLGLTYRKLGKNKKAVDCYKKSLMIYPEGSFALQNLAVAYTNINNYAQAIDCYERLTFFYPDDAEGYYGTGRVFYLMGDYENSLDYLFIAHKIYLNQKSDYVSDTENLISVIHDKLKNLNKLEIFNQKARQYGISVN